MRPDLSLAALGILLLAVACAQPSAEPVRAVEAQELAFRHAHQQAPADWPGPTFRLSHDYPGTHPGKCEAEVCKWLDVDVDFSGGPGKATPTWDGSSTDYKGTWREYIEAVKEYVFQGQDPDLPDRKGFATRVNDRTRWFHVPWMTYDDTSGREFVHGTTNERTAHLEDLIGDGRGFGVHALAGVDRSECEETFPHGFETWSVGLYNEWGGHAIGQVFPQGRPAIGSYRGSPMPKGLPFTEGTAVVKLLFTNAPASCVSFLKGSAEWQVNRHAIDPETRKYLCRREVQVSRLVQVDIAVVDERAPMRWVYGTFAYDGTSAGKTVVDRLIAVGAQWGSDPWSFPAVPDSNRKAIYQSVTNPGLKIPENLGCRRRLAGPVDNPQSSCISCHASAYAAPGGVPLVMGSNTPPSFGFPGICDTYSAQNVNYFQNIVPPESYAGGHYPEAFSLDTSLQLWVAFDQYGNFNTFGRPAACTDPDEF